MAGADCRDESVDGNEFKKMLASAGVEFLTSANGEVVFYGCNFLSFSS